MALGKNHTKIALLFLAPNFLGFLLFTLVPVLISFVGSFTTWSLRPSVKLEFIGLSNYIELFKDKNFYFYFYNTIYLMMAAPISIAGSLFLAVVLSQKLKLRGYGANKRLSLLAAGMAFLTAGALWMTGSHNTAIIALALGFIGSLGFLLGSVSYRVFFYLPHFTAGAATVLLWQQIYNPNYGLLNQLLSHVGVSHDQLPGWHTSTKSLLGFLPLPDFFNDGGFGFGARESIMIMSIWGAVGGNHMLLYLAGLSNISPELYEAADMDGANGWQRFCYITFPQLAPTTFFIIVMSVIHGLQGGFEQARLMTEGGPAGITTTLSYYIYTQGFERLDLGYGASVAWVLFAVIFGLTLLNWKFGNKDVAN